jgi:hypothetical protein
MRAMQRFAARPGNAPDSWGSFMACVDCSAYNLTRFAYYLTRYVLADIEIERRELSRGSLVELDLS